MYFCYKALSALAEGLPSKQIVMGMESIHFSIFNTTIKRRYLGCVYWHD